MEPLYNFRSLLLLDSRSMFVLPSTQLGGTIGECHGKRRSSCRHEAQLVSVWLSPPPLLPPPYLSPRVRLLLGRLCVVSASELEWGWPLCCDLDHYSLRRVRDAKVHCIGEHGKRASASKIQCIAFLESCLWFPGTSQGQSMNFSIVCVSRSRVWSHAIQKSLARFVSRWMLSSFGISSQSCCDCNWCLFDLSIEVDVHSQVLEYSKRNRDVLSELVNFLVEDLDDKLFTKIDVVVRNLYLLPRLLSHHLYFFITCCQEALELILPGGVRTQPDGEMTVDPKVMPRYCISCHFQRVDFLKFIEKIESRGDHLSTKPHTCLATFRTVRCSSKPWRNNAKGSFTQAVCYFTARIANLFGFGLTFICCNEGVTTWTKILCQLFPSPSCLSQKRHFVRMLDEDRSGTVEVSEVESMILKERLLRIEKRLLPSFQRHADPSTFAPDEPLAGTVRRNKFKLVFSDLCGSSIPKDWVEDSKVSLGKKASYYQLRTWLSGKISSPENPVNSNPTRTLSERDIELKVTSQSWRTRYRQLKI